MSREDPQLRIRLPVELKEKIDETAKSNNRSTNAEIVQRLDASFFVEIQEDEIISAQEAIQIANKAKDELSKIIFKRTFSEIVKKIRVGHTAFSVELGDLELSMLEEQDIDSVFALTFNKLKELGYNVPKDGIDSEGFVIEIPEPIKKPT